MWPLKGMEWGAGRKTMFGESSIGGGPSKRKKAFPIKKTTKGKRGGLKSRNQRYIVKRD